MYKLCEKHCINWYATYFYYKQYAQCCQCRINVFNIVFIHFLVFNEWKITYFKIIQWHSIVMMIPQFHTLLALQNTLTKMPVQHFPITYEAVTNTFMLDANHRNTPPPFWWPYTCINLRYTTIRKSQDGVVIRVT